MNTYILVVDDEPDVEALFRQQFRRDVKSGRFIMEFAMSAPAAPAAVSSAGPAVQRQEGEEEAPEENAVQGAFVQRQEGEEEPAEESA